MLDVISRGLLEGIIDEAKTSLPGILRNMREKKDNVHIKNAEDYTLGLGVGYIIGKFSTTFFMLKGRLPDGQEQSQISQVIFHRTPELREALFKNG